MENLATDGNPFREILRAVLIALRCSHNRQETGQQSKHRLLAAWQQINLTALCGVGLSVVNQAANICGFWTVYFFTFFFFFRWEECYLDFLHLHTLECNVPKILVDSHSGFQHWVHGQYGNISKQSTPRGYLQRQHLITIRCIYYMYKGTPQVWQTC